jgi:hypothetical protein
MSLIGAWGGVLGAAGSSGVSSGAGAALVSYADHFKTGTTNQISTSFTPGVCNLVVCVIGYTVTNVSDVTWRGNQPDYELLYSDNGRCVLAWRESSAAAGTLLASLSATDSNMCRGVVYSLSGVDTTTMTAGAGGFILDIDTFDLNSNSQQTVTSSVGAEDNVAVLAFTSVSDTRPTFGAGQTIIPASGNSYSWISAKSGAGDVAQTLNYAAYLSRAGCAIAFRPA